MRITHADQQTNMGYTLRAEKTNQMSLPKIQSLHLKKRIIQVGPQ